MLKWFDTKRDVMQSILVSICQRFKVSIFYLLIDTTSVAQREVNNSFLHDFKVIIWTLSFSLFWLLFLESKKISIIKGKNVNRTQVICPDCLMTINSAKWKRHLRAHKWEEGKINAFTSLHSKNKSVAKECPFCEKFVSLLNSIVYILLLIIGACGSSL